MAENDWNPALYQQKHAFVYEFGREVLNLLDAQANERILDVGCGTGQLTKAIAETGATVIGIDKSAEMIVTAKNNYPEIEFLVADATDFSFNEPFDAIFSNAALHWVKRAEDAVTCIARALKPKGRLVAEFGGRGNAANVAEAIRDTVKEMVNVEVNHDWYFPSIGEYAMLLENHDFNVTYALWFERQTPLEGEDGLRNWINMFCGKMLDALPENLLDDALAKIEARVKPKNFIDGVWFVDYRRLRIVASKK
ncbi:MAG: methyltransferase domain-containing protein [Acidobacteriota bacterium]